MSKSDSKRTAGRNPAAEKADDRSPSARPGISFELFPPKSPGQGDALQTCIARLAAFAPDFLSVTYGAGGSTRERSVDLVRSLIVEDDQTVAAHLTCTGASRDTVDAIARDFWDIGCRHIVALRGDPPEGIGHAFRPHPHGYRTSADLVAGLKAVAPFQISVGAYCERHPESPDWQSEIDGLKRKIDAGADQAITQFFFDSDLFESYCERVRAAGITVPIVPGILPIHDCGAVRRLAARCGATVPACLVSRFAGLQIGSDDAIGAAADFVVEQMDELVERGAGAFHFYALNRADILVRALAPTLGTSVTRTAA